MYRNTITIYTREYPSRTTSLILWKPILKISPSKFWSPYLNSLRFNNLSSYKSPDSKHCKNCYRNPRKRINTSNCKTNLTPKYTVFTWQNKVIRSLEAVRFSLHRISLWIACSHFWLLMCIQYSYYKSNLHITSTHLHYESRQNINNMDNRYPTTLTTCQTTSRIHHARTWQFIRKTF